MSTSSEVCLGALRQAAQEASDNENNPAISTEAWNQFITQSYKTLYDMLVGAYGNDYYVASSYNFVTTNTQANALPDGSPSFVSSDGTQAPKFYKLLGVDLQYSASPSGYVSLRRYEMIDRNKYAYPNTAINWWGYTNLRYRLQGNYLYLVPIPMSGQTVRVWYVPAPTSLQFRLPGYTVAGSNVIGSMTDTTGITVGMNLSGTGFQSTTTVSAVGSTTITTAATATASLNSTLISAWNDNTLVEGIAGWEEFIVVDAAMKSQGKQENDASLLAGQRQDIVARIQAMAEGRDAGQAHHVSDVMGMNYWADDDNFGPWGMGGY